MMSQAISALTATAASKGEPMATTPNMISRTPQRIDHPEACFSSEFVDCATMCASSVRLQDGTFCSQDAIYARRIRSGVGRDCGVLLGHLAAATTRSSLSPVCKLLRSMGYFFPAIACRHLP